MKSRVAVVLAFALVASSLVVLGGCNAQHLKPFGWHTGNIRRGHAAPTGNAYYGDWDPDATTITVTPVKSLNPVGTQHLLVATVRDAEGNPLPRRRVEWIIANGTVGDIVQVDESGTLDERGYKVDSHLAVSHTNTYDHVLTMGNDDPSDDVQLKAGQTWCVITSFVEGTTKVIAYAPAISDWDQHKVMVTKHWQDVAWQWPADATNPVGTPHKLMTKVMRHSDGEPLVDYEVTYKLKSGPAGSFTPGGSDSVTVKTDNQGVATVTLNQASATEGVNEIEIDVVRPADVQCCEPAAHLATGVVRKTWVGPDIAITKTGPSSAIVGDEFTYDIVVSNPSQVDVTNVVLTDTVPSGLSYVSSNPQGSASGNAVRWTKDTLPARSKFTVQMTVKADRTGTFENCAEVRADAGLSARDCATTVVTAPALAIEKTGPAEVLICDDITYTIVVRNTGDAPAQNVVVMDEMPNGMVAIINGQEARTVRSTIGTLAGGDSRQIKFTARAKQKGTFNNSANVTADGGLSGEASAQTRVLQPVLELSKTGPEMRFVGRPAEYQITVQNTGDGPAQNTTLVDTPPSGMEFVSASDGGSVTQGRIRWDLGTLQPGASKTVRVTMTARSKGQQVNRVTAEAKCATAEAQFTTEVTGIAAILLECVDQADPIEVGANEVYVITVTNQGSADDTNIVITCTLPAEQEFVSAQAPTAETVQGKTVSFAPLPSLAPKAQAVYRVTVRGTGTGDVRFGVQLTSDQTTTPVNETESTHIYE